jgi:cobalamin biosynthesis protein CobT
LLEKDSPYQRHPNIVAWLKFPYLNDDQADGFIRFNISSTIIDNFSIQKNLAKVDKIFSRGIFQKKVVEVEKEEEEKGENDEEDEDEKDEDEEEEEEDEEEKDSEVEYEEEMDNEEEVEENKEVGSEEKEKSDQEMEERFVFTIAFFTFYSRKMNLRIFKLKLNFSNSN